MIIPALAPPVLTVPADFATGLTGAVTLTATAAGTGIGVDFQIDGAVLGSVASPPFTLTLPDTGAYASGQHVFLARSRDGGGVTSPWVQAIVTFGGAVALPSGFTISTLPGTLASATAMSVAPDGRVFVCEQGGTLRIFKNGALLAAPFATLPTTANDERGLLGVTFDPAFTTNGYVYVYYTASSPAFHNRISRLTADPANPDQMAAAGEMPLVDLPGLVATNHNGGAIHFGPDGKLYAAVGNNAVNSNSPSLATTLGKVLRYNPDGSIPPDNPFYALATGANGAIWALGLRNPFTFAFQPGTTRMHINDVGENTWEEVNLGLAGANYGWPSTEGPTSAPGITGPIFAYGHSDGTPPGQPQSTGTFLTGTAILGAAFDGPASAAWPAAYLGSYYFSDLSGGWVARKDLASGAVSIFANGFGSMRDLAFGVDGSLYLLGQSSLQRIVAP
jgi:glucose/arabinose dehydrogenase